MPRRVTTDSVPPSPVGDDETARWLKWVHEQIAHRLQLIDAPGIRFERTTRGIKPIIAVGRGGGALATPMFPFKIMLSPPNPDFTGTDQEIADEHLDKDWRTFRVRDGLMGLEPVDFTDNVGNPDDSTVPPFLEFDSLDATSCDFLLPKNSTVLVYIDANGLPLEIHMEDETALPAPIDPTWSTADGWDDGKYILLGWIDLGLGTNATNRTAAIRQLVRADLPEYFETSVCVGGVWTTIRLPARIIV